MAKKTVSNSGGYAKLKTDLKSGNLEKCYIFYGEEGYLHQYHMERLRKKLVDDLTEEFNYHTYTNRQRGHGIRLWT